MGVCVQNLIDYVIEFQILEYFRFYRSSSKKIKKILANNLEAIYLESPAQFIEIRPDLPFIKFIRKIKKCPTQLV